ncbi:hypothetical protein CCM_02254 [Cordyceps militaris CM01]|uniref:Uncharacterized protein n=2 Tax=Cordyceps militaris TaxID=73501 RepID=G3J8P8_CORMM|nr:uncharacterized protein CCM_02254 [Cordyceps militaris CM01]ATY59920.1 hypothetical protein A9K55_006656 [Cordyceps militaris]EGX93983.1 hypothetical protein CCM_02254 [Cordyceps militaris CM01]
MPSHRVYTDAELLPWTIRLGLVYHTAALISRLGQIATRYAGPNKLLISILLVIAFNLAPMLNAAVCNEDTANLAGCILWIGALFTRGVEFMEYLSQTELESRDIVTEELLLPACETGAHKEEESE